MTVTVDEIQVADPSDAWTRAGFTVDPEAVSRIGGVRIRLVGRAHGTGIIGWSLRGLGSDTSLDDLDGVATTRSNAVAAVPATHANGVTAIDHVVLLSPACVQRSNRWPRSVWTRAGNATANSADDRSARSSSASGR
jgi:7-keto-8-aminopelargonate synthetase-like enzyme